MLTENTEKDAFQECNMPSYIIDLYIYFLCYGTTKSRVAFERFYNADKSRQWVKLFAIRGKEFYAKYMSKYSQEIREREKIPFSGVITPRGVFKC
jgi:hypothetical protein